MRGVPSDISHNNLRIGMIEGIMATPWAYLGLPANFIMVALLTHYYGIGPGVYGFIASTPAWSNALQILLIPFMARFLTARDLTISMAWLNLGLWAMMTASLSFIPRDVGGAAARIFLIFFILASISGAFISVGWLNWIQHWVPSRIRGKYFGKRNRLLSITTMCLLIVSMILLEGRGDSIWPYQVIILLAVLMRFISCLFNHLIVSPSAERESLIQKNWFHELAGLTRHRNFLIFVFFAAWVNFWMNMTSPFAPVFVYQYIGFTPFQFAILIISSTISGAFAMPIWGKLIDRFGGIPIISASLVLWQTQNYLWCILNPESSWLLYPMWFWGGLTSPGFILGSFTLLLKLIPKNMKMAGISLNLAVSSVVAGLSPILSGLLLTYCRNHELDEVTLYRLGFFLSPTAIMVGIFLLRKIKEPEVAQVMSVGGAMRIMRQSMQIQGLAFLANASPFNRFLDKKNHEDDSTS